MSRFWYGDHGWMHPAASHARKLFLDLFEEQRKFTRPLAANVAADERELEKLTDSQFSVISAISGNPRVAIAGGAGSGKTWLARKRAIQLAEEGFRVLLTCQSRIFSNPNRGNRGSIDNCIKGSGASRRAAWLRSVVAGDQTSWNSNGISAPCSRCFVVRRFSRSK